MPVLVYHSLRREHCAHGAQADRVGTRVVAEGQMKSVRVPLGFVTVSEWREVRVYKCTRVVPEGCPFERRQSEGPGHRE